tara:strand:+ start:482 stop:706 length:225 start_codon:yes stop_codon:yes gene_type:complete
MKQVTIIVLFLVNMLNQAFAQCAMCKSVVESNIDGGSTIGSGLNDGILYLMAMPYLALAIVAFAWMRYNKRLKA